MNLEYFILTADKWNEKARKVGILLMLLGSAHGTEFLLYSLFMAITLTILLKLMTLKSVYTKFMDALCCSNPYDVLSSPKIVYAELLSIPSYLSCWSPDSSLKTHLSPRKLIPKRVCDKLRVMKRFMCMQKLLKISKPLWVFCILGLFPNTNLSLISWIYREMNGI